MCAIAMRRRTLVTPAFCVLVLAATAARLQETVAGDARQLRTDYQQENWRAVQPDDRVTEDLRIPAHVAHSEVTLAHGERFDDAADDPLPKRRRPLRKRKRRPYLPNLGDTPARKQRLRRPPHADGREHYLDDHWQGEALEEEDGQYGPRPTQKRRRLNPVYDEPVASTHHFSEDVHGYHGEEAHHFDEHEETFRASHAPVDDDDFHQTDIEADYRINAETPKQSRPDKSYRKPYTPHRNQDEPTVTPKAASIKALLKQGGGLSLVEILQQKNVSLADLLKGKEVAISALTNTPATITERGDFADHRDDDERISHRRDDGPIVRRKRPSNYPEDNGGNTESENYPRQKPQRLPPALKRQHKEVPDPSDNHHQSSEADTESIAHRRLPPARLPKIKNDIPDQSDPEAMKDHINAQRKRLSSLRTEKDNRVYHNDLKHVDVVTEATTERRIFIPSKYRTKSYESNDNEAFTPRTRIFTFLPTVLPPIEEEEELESIVKTTVTVPPTTTTTHRYQHDMIIKENGKGTTRNRLALKPRIRLPNFRDDTRQKTTPEPTVTTTKIKPTTAPSNPTKGFAINFKDIFGIGEIMKEAAKEKETEGPFRISMNFDKMFTEPEVSSKQPPPIPSAPRVLTAEEEIMEVINDSVGRERLSRILATRNMTFGELVALRERGSSQLHLADIFHNQTKEPIPEEHETIVKVNQHPDTITDRVSITSFDTFPDIAVNPSLPPIAPAEIKQDSDGSSYFTSVVKILPPKTDSVFREPRQHYFNVENPQPDPTMSLSIKETTNLEPGPNFYQNTGELFPNVARPADLSYFTHQELPQMNSIRPSREHVQSHLPENTVQADAMDTNIVNAINDRLNYLDQADLDDDEYMKLPAGVRSAIIASSAIVGSSIVIFLTIFIVFKWRQKRRRRLRYSGSFSGAKVKLPILESIRKSKTRREVMVNVTSSSKNPSFTNEDPDNPNIQQYLWDTLRKPFH